MLFDSVDFPRVGSFAGRPVVPGAHDAPGKATQRGRSVTFVTFRASAARTRRLERMRSWSNLCLTFHALGRHLLADAMEAAAAGQDMVGALAHHRAGDRKSTRLNSSH